MTDKQELKIQLAVQQQTISALNEQHIKDLIVKQELLDVIQQIIVDAESQDDSWAAFKSYVSWFSLNKGREALKKWSASGVYEMWE